MPISSTEKAAPLPLGDVTNIKRIFERTDRYFLLTLLTVSILIGLRGIYHYGYIGQDFNSHHVFMLGFPQTFTFETTNPIGLYLLGSAIYHHVSSIYYLEILASFFLLINSAALCGIYVLIWKVISSRPLRLSAALLVSIIPFRIIHSVVIAADAFSLPFFVIIAIFTIRLIESPQRIINWIVLSTTLSISLTCKYTFCGILPALALILILAIIVTFPFKQWLRWTAITMVTLAIPAGIFLYEMHESSRKGDGIITNAQWLAPGAPSIMRWRDILLPKKNDVNLLSAPQYFKDRLYDDRKFSYMGLVHIGAFTDPMNFFQPPPENVEKAKNPRYREEFFRTREFYSRVFQRLALSWSLPFSVLSLVGLFMCLGFSVPVLINRSTLFPKAMAVLFILAFGFYGPVVFSLPRICIPYVGGYWLPRLVLPSLVVFFVLGFVLLDVLATRNQFLQNRLRGISFAVLGYTAVACVMYICFLTSPWSSFL